MTGGTSGGGSFTQAVFRAHNPTCDTYRVELNNDGWRDLNQRIEALTITPAEAQALIAHLTDRLVGHFGTDVVECHLGKDDPQRHSMHEVAAAALAHLAPVVDLLPENAVADLRADNRIASPVPAPWDDHWRTQGRTAGWRS